jgi:GTP cyclohydrolase I
MELDPQALALFTEGYTKILEGIGRLGYDVDDANFKDTAARAAKALHELVNDQKQVKPAVAKLLAKTFPAKYTEMVISKHNTAFGVCPHHLLPVIYRISMAYIPTDKVLGLSKLSRLARMIARGPRLQEDLTHELAEILHTRLETRGSAAYVEGLCEWE